MRDSMADATWQLTEVTSALDEDEADDADGAPPGRLDLEIDGADRALLEEAMHLTKLQDPREVLKLALRELVERQRFLSWVAQHDPRERGGTA